MKDFGSNMFFPILYKKVVSVAFNEILQNLAALEW